jgi:ankyrin repeat protein
MSSVQEISQVDTQPANNANISPVRYQAQLLTALRTRDLNSFSQLLQQAAVDADGFCLELACRNADCTDFVKLLLQHGADPNTLNPILQETPLHIAAELGYYQTLQLLLHDARINVNALNGSHQTALHAVVNKCGQACNEDDVARYRQCVDLLLDWPSNVKEWTTGTADHQQPLDVNTADWLGNTALHYAAQSKDQYIVLTLLEHGSYIGSINHAGETPISGIDPETLEKFFNTRLKMPSDESLLFKYDFLVPAVDLDSVLMKNNYLSEDADDVMMKLNSPSPEMDPLVQINLSPKLQHLLLHPILSSFIQLKWQLTKKFYYYNVAFYVVFVLLLTFLVVHHYTTANHEETHSCWSSVTVFCFFKIIAFLLLAIFCFCLIVKLMFHFVISPVQYLCKWKNYPQILLTFLVIAVLFSTGEKALTAITLFIAWTRLLLLTGEHPAISLYFQIFKKVSSMFIKYLAWYSFLIIAFSLSFYVLFHDSMTYTSERNTSSTFFHSPFSSLFTTIGISLGGFKTTFLPFNSATGTSHIIFILFTFFVSLVLISIFTGLAVGQIQKVQRKAELVCLQAKVNAVSDIERLLMGNPIYIHLRMRWLYLSRNAVIVWIVKSSVCVWLLCNWLQCSKNLQRKVILFPDSGYEHANIVFPFGSWSKVTCNYSMDHKILRRAADIVQENHETGQQLEYQALLISCDERLKNIEASLVRSEALQESVLQLLSSPRV